MIAQVTTKSAKAHQKAEKKAEKKAAKAEKKAAAATSAAESAKAKSDTATTARHETQAELRDASAQVPAGQGRAEGG